jgi:hypothetical protein
MDEELDSLREQSTRASSVYDDLEGDEYSEESGGLLGQFSSSQKLILALLLFLNVVALACVILAWTGQLAQYF